MILLLLPLPLPPNPNPIPLTLPIPSGNIGLENNPEIDRCPDCQTGLIMQYLMRVKQWQSVRLPIDGLKSVILRQPSPTLCVATGMCMKDISFFLFYYIVVIYNICSYIYTYIYIYTTYHLYYVHYYYHHYTTMLPTYTTSLLLLQLLPLLYIHTNNTTTTTTYLLTLTPLLQLHRQCLVRFSGYN